MNKNDIEPITSDNWHEAAAALCRSAMTYETLLVKCLELRPELVEDVIVEFAEDIDTTNAVVQHWREFLEVTTE